MELVWNILFIFTFFIIMLGALTYHNKQFKKSKNSLYKIVQQSGAKNIQIEGGWWTRDNTSCHFVVKYVDAHGNLQIRNVAHHRDVLEGKANEFLWNQPL